MVPDVAVVWDYDGTLVDTREKNLRVTRQLIPDVTGRPLEEFPALASPAAYSAANRRSANWRVLFGKEFGLNDEQVDEAGRLWTRYQLADEKPAPIFRGIPAGLARLRGIRQVIFSQNSQQTIVKALEAEGLAGYFSLVVGYEEVSFDRQKPAPDGLLFCLREIGLDAGIAFYVGDHDTDVECARRANVALRQNKRELKVVAVGADFSGDHDGQWQRAPDAVARRLEEVADLVLELGRDR